MMFARTMRAICGTYRMPMAAMMPNMDWPRIETNTAARAMPGTDMNTSMTRMMISEIHVRATAAIAPMSAPSTKANRMDSRPMTSEYRAP